MFLKIMVFAFALIIGASPGVAWEPVEILSSEGMISVNFMSYGSPTPSYCSWYSDEFTAPAFSVTNADGHGNSNCPNPWTIRCDGSGLEIHATWPGIKWDSVYHASLVSDLSCTVVVNDETRLLASRSVEANLTNDEHIITVLDQDGSSSRVLWRGSSARQVNLVLAPGTYTINLNINAFQTISYNDSIDPYDGHLLLSFSDPSMVSVSKRSFGEVKSLYR